MQQRISQWPRQIETEERISKKYIMKMTMAANNNVVVTTMVMTVAVPVVVAMVGMMMMMMMTITTTTTIHSNTSLSFGVGVSAFMLHRQQQHRSTFSRSRIATTTFTSPPTLFPTSSLSRITISSSIISTITRTTSTTKTSTSLFNIYDDWMNDIIVVDSLDLNEENVQQVIDEVIDSNFGQSMFGCNERASSIGITGNVELIELSGPEVILKLDGEFWHTRSFVLGKLALYLNARIPEIVEVNVEDSSELLDFEDIIDEDTGELLFVRDKRSPDYNGDRSVMEYQGSNPDMRGPFPQSVILGGDSSGSMINPI